MTFAGRHVTAIIPALNEAPSICKVVVGLLAQHSDGVRIVDDVIVGDNGSTDGTGSAAMAAGARVVREPYRGYGAACLRALAAMRATDLVVFVDADGSVDPRELKDVLRPVCDAADLSIGSRTLGKCEPDAMSGPQRSGNALATLLMRRLLHCEVTDLGPFRAIRAEALAALRMRDRRFGWTVEMQLRARLAGLKTVEVPVTTRARRGRSKVSGTWLGVVRAGYGIVSTILWLWAQHRLRGVIAKAHDALAGGTDSSSRHTGARGSSAPAHSRLDDRR